MTALQSGEGGYKRFFARMSSGWIKIIPVVVVLTALMFIPVIQLLSLSFETPEGQFTWGQYTRLFTSAVYVDVMLVTLKISGWTTLATVLCSYPVAYAIATRSSKTKGQLLFWVLLAFWTSFLVRTFGWVVLLGRNGLINQVLQGLQITDASFEMLYTFGGVVVGISHALMPLCILTMVPVMENIDANILKAGTVFGARPGSNFWRLYFPLSMPGVAAGALLVFITALGFFITPTFLGGSRQTMITQVIIEQIQELLNWSFAGALSMLLLIVALIIFYLYDRIVGLSTLSGMATQGAQEKVSFLSRGINQVGFRICVALGYATDAVFIVIEKLFQPASGNRPRRRFGSRIQWAIACAVLVFLSLPAFIMVPISFTDGSSFSWPQEGLGLRWYVTLFNSPLWMEAAFRSVLVALGCACLAMLVGTPAAYAIARQRMRGKTLLLAFILSPLIIPRMIIAVALFYLYAKIGLVGSYVGLILGHTVLAIPYVVITIIAVLKNYDERYDHAAWSLGAGRLTTMMRITFPLIKGGLASAFLFAFITSFDELTIALFVTGGLTTTLPKQMWDGAILMVTPTLAAVSTLMLVFVTVLIVVVAQLQKRSVIRN